LIQPSLSNWQYVFFISAAIYMFDFLFFASFASTDEQWWNRGESDKLNARDDAVLKKLNPLKD
jgi:hypothetical protein